MDTALRDMFQRVSAVPGAPIRVRQDEEGGWAVEALGYWWSVGEDMLPGGAWMVVGALLQDMADKPRMPDLSHDGHMWSATALAGTEPGPESARVGDGTSVKEAYLDVAYIVAGAWLAANT